MVIERETGMEQDRIGQDRAGQGRTGQDRISKSYMIVATKIASCTIRLLFLAEHHDEKDENRVVHKIDLHAIELVIFS